jgi:hypothetical protein
LPLEWAEPLPDTNPDGPGGDPLTTNPVLESRRAGIGLTLSLDQVRVLDKFLMESELGYGVNEREALFIQREF